MIDMTRARGRLRRLALAGAWCIGALAGHVDAAGVSPTLVTDTAFPVIGDTVTLTLEGTPGGSWLLLFALAPGETPLGAKGTLLVDAATFSIVLSGTVPAGGSVVLPLPIPNAPEAAGVVVHLQGAVTSPGTAALTAGSVSLRLSDAAPSAPRRPVAVAVTPDGTRAFVAHRADASISVIDAVNDSVLHDVPVANDPRDVVVDDDGRHAFVVCGDATSLAVLDAATGSLTQNLSVPRGCRSAAWNASSSPPTLLVTNVRDDVVLRWREEPPGTFTSLPSVPLRGRGPHALAALDDGRVAVALHNTTELEIVDPALLPGDPFLGAVALDGVPMDVIAHAGELLVSLFGHTPIPGTLGSNKVLRVDPNTFAVMGKTLEDEGTDYVAIATSPDGATLAAVGAGSGTVVVADGSTFGVIDRVVLAPLQPNATPEDAAFVPAAPPGVGADRLYVVNNFRESVRSVRLDMGTPLVLGPEIALAHSGNVKVALVDLSPEEDGRWFFRSVEYMNSTPLMPNNVTCATCHPDGGANHRVGARQVPPVWENGSTGPWGWKGNTAVLDNAVQATFFAHSQFGGMPPPGSVALITTYLSTGNPAPASPFRLADGSLSPQAEAGRVIFEGSAGCSTCHTAPFFIPAPPAPATIAGGIPALGTSLSPANVPMLLGLWATSPYLSDGSAPTLFDVLDNNPGDVHGTTSTLTQPERAALVEYLLSL